MSAVLCLVVISSALLAMGITGLRQRGVLGALLVAQAVYWTLGYVVRPLILLRFAPPPRIGDSIADSRLYDVGYPAALGAVLTPAAIGLTGYAVLMVGLARRSRRTMPTAESAIT